MIKYLHIVQLDKFTEGFVKFIFKNFETEEHAFIISGDNNFLFSYNSPNVEFFDSYRRFKSNSKVLKWFKECKLIIVNGVFGNERCFINFSKKYLNKTYLMFWGGDFYSLKNKNKSLKNKLFDCYKKIIISKASGVINLVAKDYDELCKIAKPSGKHFIAPMCDDGTNYELRKKLSNIEKSNNPIRIIIGNSASETNNHIEAFELISRFKNEDIQIICPLSYGDKLYAEKIIDKGTQIFGSKFYPLTEYMDKEDYFRFMATAKIAIFNNNRQQAMGNIFNLLGLGTKVYIRNDTSMWDYITKERKLKVYDCAEISNISFKELMYYPSDFNENNKLILNPSIRSKMGIDLWKKVFESCD